MTTTYQINKIIDAKIALDAAKEIYDELAANAKEVWGTGTFSSTHGFVKILDKAGARRLDQSRLIELAKAAGIDVDSCYSVSEPVRSLTASPATK